MVTSREGILIGFILITIFSCKEPRLDKQQSQPAMVVHQINKDSLWRKLNDNIHFYGDSLLNNKTFLIRHLVNTYQSDTCGTIAYQDSALRAGFEGIKPLGDVNGNKIPDSVIVMPPFNYCDDGDSYYFFDTTLPRLYTDSYCCHPDNLFTIGDIDEDGIMEVCIYYSSCVSRYKSLIVYTLKNNTWKKVGQCTFDTFCSEPEKELRVRKVAKGKFEMLEILDKEENKNWKQFSF